MNERIKLLAKQCTVSCIDGRGVELNEIDVEKFAELIVRECGKICDGVQEKYGQYTFTARVCKEEIKENFGVE